MWISTSTGLCYSVRLWLVQWCLTFYLLFILPRLTSVFELIELAQASHPKESINTQLLPQALLPRELGIDTRLSFFAYHSDLLFPGLLCRSSSFLTTHILPGDLIHCHDLNYWGFSDLHLRLLSWASEPRIQQTSPLKSSIGIQTQYAQKFK